MDRISGKSNHDPGIGAGAGDGLYRAFAELAVQNLIPGAEKHSVCL